MSFSSDAAITVPGDADTVFTHLSTKSSFLSLMWLSPFTDTINITRRERVMLFPDLTYRVMSEDEFTPDSDTLKNARNPEEREGEIVRRLHFELVERVTFLGIPVSVTVIGTQINSFAQRLHLYESTASNEFVKIRKIRRFVPVENTGTEKVGSAETRIEEKITGQTNRLMSYYVGRECKRAHSAQVSQYARLLPVNLK